MVWLSSRRLQWCCCPPLVIKRSQRQCHHGQQRTPAVSLKLVGQSSPFLSSTSSAYVQQQKHLDFLILGDDWTYSDLLLH